jgi:hypothetical protein
MLENPLNEFQPPTILSFMLGNEFGDDDERQRHLCERVV